MRMRPRILRKVSASRASGAHPRTGERGPELRRRRRARPSPDGVQHAGPEPLAAGLAKRPRVVRSSAISAAPATGAVSSSTRRAPGASAWTHAPSVSIRSVLSPRKSPPARTRSNACPVMSSRRAARIADSPSSRPGPSHDVARHLVAALGRPQHRRRGAPRPLAAAARALEQLGRRPAAVEAAQELGQLGLRPSPGVGVGDGPQRGVRDVAGAAGVAELGPLAERAELRPSRDRPAEIAPVPAITTTPTPSAVPARRAMKESFVTSAGRAQPQLVGLGGHPGHVGVPVDARQPEGRGRQVAHLGARRLEGAAGRLAERLPRPAQADDLPVRRAARREPAHGAVGVRDDGVRLGAAAVDSEDERHPAARNPADR